jgi:AAA+ superfamily predicted ATPase
MPPARSATDPIADIELLIKSRYGLIVVDSIEEERVETVLRLVADRMGLALFHWSRAKGLRRDGYDNAVYGTTEPGQLLAHLVGSTLPSLYHLSGIQSVLATDSYAEQLKDVAMAYSQRPSAVVLSGGGLDLPETLRRLAAAVSLPGPDTQDYRELLEHLLRDLGQRTRVRVDMPEAEVARLLNHMKGLTLLEAEKILTKAIVEDGRLSHDDVSHVIAAKKDIVEREGVLEYYPVEETMAHIADLAGLKAWLAKRKNIITAPEEAMRFGLSFPKGVLLIGVPGCGKSLCAKAVAMEWSLPLLKLDPGGLYNKYIGETEKNFKRAMQTAERLAPCVLFIDELEKAFASGGSEDGGVSQRVLGTFLSWLQDRRGDVFTVATANDVSRLPPEFLRKGRFDEVFFVDLPNEGAREQIVRIHLRKRNQDVAGLDVMAIVRATAGFSGAEVEQVIVSALYTAFSDSKPLSTELLLAEVHATRPLSQTMAERVQSLRQWAAGRTVSAN